MKSRSVKELFKQTSVKVTGVVLAAAIAVGCVWAVNYNANNVPELVSYVDTEDVVTVDEDEVPLASNSKTTTSSKTEKSTVKVKMSTKATETKTVKGKTTTTTSTQKSSTASTQTTTKTTVKTRTDQKYTKGSKTRKDVTTTKTTVKKTVVTKSSSSSASTASTASTSTGTTIATLAPKVDSRVSSAWNTLGFSFVINSGVSYSGLFSAKDQTITLKAAGDTAYHELGHFLAFIAGNVDTSSSFASVYASEKSLYTGYNKSYATQDASEYFAESFKDYTLDPASLKSSRPQTYAAIEAALDKVTTSQVTKIATVYASVWK